MGEQQGSVRTNVSLPRELKARMDAADASVNWSAVAAAAFEAKLLELESTKEATTMDEVIARMKAADELDNKEQYQEGRRAGDGWARQARPRQLRKLDKTVRTDDYDPAGWMYVWNNGLNRGHVYHLAEAILGPEPGAEAVEGFWTDVLGEDGSSLIEDEDFALGFIEGALDLWDKVESKL